MLEKWPLGLLPAVKPTHPASQIGPVVKEVERARVSVELGIEMTLDRKISKAWPASQEKGMGREVRLEARKQLF